ncbi:MAG: hypothetical protein ABI353_00295 [Isosphaeraceae bacterium]
MMNASFPAIRRRAITALALAIGFAPQGLQAQEGATAPDPAVAEVTKAGGKVDRDDKGEGKPVVTVNFATTSVGDEAIDLLKPFTSLKKLSLNGTKITDAGLEKLKDRTSLEKLYLVDTKITDAGLEHLKGLTNLQVLSLVGTEVTDAGLEHLKGLSNLQDLFLYGAKVTDEGVKKLKEALPKAKIEK